VYLHVVAHGRSPLTHRPAAEAGSQVRKRCLHALKRLHLRHLSQLRNKLTWVGRIEGILVLQLCDQNLKEVLVRYRGQVGSGRRDGGARSRGSRRTTGSCSHDTLLYANTSSKPSNPPPTLPRA